jgi:hypothetical protein
MSEVPAMSLSLPATLFAAALALLDAAEPTDPRAPAPREIKLARGKLDPVRERFDRPRVAATAEELAKLVPDKDAQGAIAKEVDFKKEQLLLFRWSGSGQDSLSFRTNKIEDGEEVVFSYTPGRTRDLRPHAKLYAVPKKMTYRLGK